MKRTAALICVLGGALITIWMSVTGRLFFSTPVLEQITQAENVGDGANAVPLVNIQQPPLYDPALDALNLPGASIQKDLLIVHGILDRYRFIVKEQRGNPLGDNREIVRALQGRNRAGIAFLPRRHPAINDQGELVDRWGTPFFFHALAHDRMEIRSAGPDQQFWTADDTVYPPRRRPDDYPISLTANAIGAQNLSR